MRKYFLGFVALLICPPMPGQEPNLPGMAVGVLEQSRLARAAAASRDTAGALDHIAQAAKLASDIQRQPHDASRPLLVPVYTDIDSVSMYGPVKRGKNDELTARRMKRQTSVRETTAEITRASLNIGEAADRLEAARAALERRDFAGADAALAGVENAVVRESANRNAPLLRARQNLGLARARVLENKFKDAAAPLRAAADALDDYRRISPGPQGVTAASMAHDIRTFADAVHRLHGDALQKIDAWMGPVNQWFNEAVK